MRLTIYNKPASRQGSLLTEQVIAPARGAACDDMNWHDHFTYNPETGQLLRAMPGSPKFGRAAGYRQFNGRIGSPHRSPHSIRINVLGKFYVAHRIIWEMHNGPIPEGVVIDHINGNPFDNTMQNLRLATMAENSRNSRTPRNNKHGFKGVRQLPGGKFQARIVVSGKHIALGVASTLEDAHKIYCLASKKYHGDFGRFR